MPRRSVTVWLALASIAASSSLPMLAFLRCLRTCACQNVLASVVQHRRETSSASPGCTIHALSRRAWPPLNYGRAPSTPCARNRAGAPKPKWVDAFQRSPRAFRQKFCSFAGPQVMVVSERSFDLPLAFSCSGRWCHGSRWYLSSYSFQGYACAASSISDTPVQQLLASHPPNEVLDKRMWHPRRELG